jgi:hypothetical protein
MNKSITNHTLDPCSHNRLVKDLPDATVTHYLDLNIVTKGIHKEMRFLITNIGREEILLGYPWLATFEPKFDWKSAKIEPWFVPVIISSVNPQITQITTSHCSHPIRRRETLHCPTIRIRMHGARYFYGSSGPSWDTSNSGKDP